MIINNDTKPEQKIYYLGAKLIKILNEIPQLKVDILTAFQLLNNEEKISMNLFTLTLDWLFILGVIKNNNGKLEKCF
jgi:hypothetical protein